MDPRRLTILLASAAFLAGPTFAGPPDLPTPVQPTPVAPAPGKPGDLPVPQPVAPAPMPNKPGETPQPLPTPVAPVPQPVAPTPMPNKPGETPQPLPTPVAPVPTPPEPDKPQDAPNQPVELPTPAADATPAPEPVPAPAPAPASEPEPEPAPEATPPEPQEAAEPMPMPDPVAQGPAPVLPDGPLPAPDLVQRWHPEESFDRHAAWDGIAISRDGDILVGYGPTQDGVQAFVWTHEDGMLPFLGDLDPRRSEALAISADGTVIGGALWPREANDDREDPRNPRVPFVWSLETGTPIDIGVGTGQVRAINADGTVVAGTMPSPEHEDRAAAFVWSSEIGLRNLGAEGCATGATIAFAISDDGQTVIGEDCGSAFVWTPSRGVSVLQPLEEGDYEVGANDISADGRVIVGHSERVAVRWVDGTPEALTGLEDWSRAIATAVSADGQWIIGQGAGPGHSDIFANDGFLWHEALGAIPIPHPGEDYIGLWPHDISGDGSLIAGSATERTRSLDSLPFLWTPGIVRPE